ncbi:MAG: hypothetical protein Q9219_005975 [cf. Caloplaca sp. 3 TL-2023]
MCDTRRDTRNRHQEALPSAIAARISEDWYGRLNEVGPDVAFAPFVNDDPPFYLRRRLSEASSTHAVQTDRLSSRPAQSSQPAPLSRSLLSQLALGDHDPDTYREVIDDLTVQNKKLKKKLKKYEKSRFSRLEHDGLFEVRVLNLSLEKKQELESILQDFASTICSSQSKPSSVMAGLGSIHEARIRKMEQNPIPRSSPHTKVLDSAYASTDTGATIKAISGSSDRPVSTSHEPIISSAGHDQHPPNQGVFQGMELRSAPIVSDRAKQQLVVDRLEELFLHGDNRGQPFDADRIHAHALHLGVSHEDFLVTSSTGIAKTEVQTNQSFRMSTDTSRINRSNLPQMDSQQTRNTTGLYQLPKLLQHVDKPLLESQIDNLRYLRHLGIASPVAGSSLELLYEWVYLNILINLAQLHTLNVTPEFVRQAIQSISNRLILSKDGRKVRWQGGLQHTMVSTDGPGDSSATSSPTPIPTLAQYLHKEELPQDITRPGASDNQPPRDKIAHQLLTTPLHYKPLFAHSYRRHEQFSCRSSKTSDGSVSAAEAVSTASYAPREIVNVSNGPLVFFDGDPFFLDLSADPVETDHTGYSSYTAVCLQPFGHEASPLEVHHDYIRQQPLQPDLVLENKEHETQGLSLYIDKGDVSTPLDEPEESLPIPFQASGIGGVQLEDNISIDVTLLQQTQRPSPHHQQPYIHLCPISTRTTQLPASPLPPPSYVYPNISSSTSDCGNGNESPLDELESNPDSEIEFRKVSLSPPVRLWVKSQLQDEAGEFSKKGRLYKLSKESGDKEAEDSGDDEHL